MFRFSSGCQRRIIIGFPKYLQQLLSLEAVAIGLHGTLVWDIALGKKTSYIDAQTPEKLSVELAI